MVKPRKTPDGIEIPPPSPQDVLYEKHEGFARIILNRPIVLNALNKNSQRLLYAALGKAEEDSDIKAVILTGTGRAFCAGGDLYAYLYPDEAPAPSGIEVQMKIWNFPKPVIAAVRGHAVGQGCELAGVCDLTIASENTRMGEIQIRHGATPPILITPFLTSMKNAKELLLLGETVDAYEAQRIGLINRIVPNNTLEEEAEAMARKLASLPQSSVRLNKALVNRVYTLAGFTEALAYRDDPSIAGLVGGTEADQVAKERRKLLSETGWDAFKDNRDAMYRRS